MSLRAILVAVLLSLASEARRLSLPSDVGNGKGARHPCVAVFRETQQACQESSYGSASKACAFAICYTADLNRARCTDVVTDGTPVNVMYPADLDKLQKHHDGVHDSLLLF